MSYGGLGAVITRAKTGGDLSIATQQKRLGYVVGGSDQKGAVPTFRAKVTQVHGRPMRQIVPEDRKAVLEAVSANYALVERGSRQDPTQTELAGMSYGVGKLDVGGLSGRVGTWVADQVAAGNAILLFDRLLSEDGTPAIEVVATASLPSASDLTVSGQSGPHWHLLVPPKDGWKNFDRTKSPGGVALKQPGGGGVAPSDGPSNENMVELYEGFFVNKYALGAGAVATVAAVAFGVSRARKRRNRF